MKILIVEDEAFTALMLFNSMKDLGYKVCKPVATGEEAIRVAREEKPNIIFMDIGLAGTMDGIQAAEIIRSATDIPIAFMSGYSYEEADERVQKIKPAGYLIKPVLINDMKDIIESRRNL